MASLPTYRTQPQPRAQPIAPAAPKPAAALPTGAYTIGTVGRGGVLQGGQQGQQQPVQQQPTQVAPATPVAPVAAPPVTNTVAPDPAQTQFLGQMKDRIAASAQRESGPDAYQQESIKNLRDRMSTDTTQRATDVANQRVNDVAAGSQKSLTEDLARRGIRADSGVAADLSGRIGEQAQREKAGNAANIELGRQGQLDQLVLGGNPILQAPGQTNLAQQSATNSLIGGEGNAINANAQNNLASQHLGLEQYQTAQQGALAQQQLAAEQQRQQQAQQLALLQMYSSQF